MTTASTGRKPIDPHCAFCGTRLEPDVHALHACNCMQCGTKIPGWRLREDAPPMCEDCNLGVGDLDDEGNLGNMVRG